PDRLPARSRRVLEIKGGAQFRAVEPAVTSRSGQGRLQAAAANRAVQGRLADSEKARRLAGGDEPGAFGLILQACGVDLHIGFGKPPVSTGRDERRAEQTARHGAGHGGLAHAKPLCYIPRTDQSLQRRLLRLTNPYQKSVGVLPLSVDS